MTVLIVFATTEGHTKKIAEKTSEILINLGQGVELYDCAHDPQKIDLKAFHGVVLAGSIHQGKHHKTLTSFIVAHRSELQNMPTALLSVSLSAAFDEGLSEAQSYVDELLQKSGWKPSQIQLLGGALKQSEYDYFKEQFVRFVVLRDREIDVGKDDLEFTNWQAHSEFINSFASSLT